MMMNNCPDKTFMKNTNSLLRDDDDHTHKTMNNETMFDRPLCNVETEKRRYASSSSSESEFFFRNHDRILTCDSDTTDTEEHHEDLDDDEFTSHSSSIKMVWDQIPINNQHTEIDRNSVNINMFTMDQKSFNFENIILSDLMDNCTPRKPGNDVKKITILVESDETSSLSDDEDESDEGDDDHENKFISSSSPFNHLNSTLKNQLKLKLSTISQQQETSSNDDLMQPTRISHDVVLTTTTTLDVKDQNFPSLSENSNQNLSTPNAQSSAETTVTNTNSTLTTSNSTSTAMNDIPTVCENSRRFTFDANDIIKAVFEGKYDEHVQKLLQQDVSQYLTQLVKKKKTITSGKDDILKHLESSVSRDTTTKMQYSASSFTLPPDETSSSDTLDTIEKIHDDVTSILYQDESSPLNKLNNLITEKKKLLTRSNTTFFQPRSGNDRPLADVRHRRKITNIGSGMIPTNFNDIVAPMSPISPKTPNSAQLNTSEIHLDPKRNRTTLNIHYSSSSDSLLSSTRNNHHSTSRYGSYSDDIYRVTILGDLGVGKTSIIHRFIKGTFSNEYNSTQFEDIYHKPLMFLKYQELKLLELLDTSALHIRHYKNKSNQHSGTVNSLNQSPCQLSTLTSTSTSVTPSNHHVEAATVENTSSSIKDSHDSPNSHQSGSLVEPRPPRIEIPSSFLSGYIVKCDAYVLVFSMDDANSYKYCKDIYKSIVGEKKMLSLKSASSSHLLSTSNSETNVATPRTVARSDVPLVLVGNKADVSLEERVIDPKMIWEDVHTNLAFGSNCSFIETSAKTGPVDCIFEALVNRICMREEPASSSKIQSSPRDPLNSRNKKCVIL